MAKSKQKVVYRYRSRGKKKRGSHRSSDVHILPTALILGGLANATAQSNNALGGLPEGSAVGAIEAVGRGSYSSALQIPGYFAGGILTTGSLIPILVGAGAAIAGKKFGLAARTKVGKKYSVF